MFINLLPPYTWGESIQRACNDLKTAVYFRSINNPFVTIIIVKEKNLIGRTFAQTGISYDRWSRRSNSRLTNQMPKCFPEITKTSSRENSIDRCFTIMLSLNTVWIDLSSFFRFSLFSSTNRGWRIYRENIIFWRFVRKNNFFFFFYNN